MNKRSTIIRRLRNNVDSRAAYIKSKLNVLVASQIRSLRLQSDTPRQTDLAKAADMRQSQISRLETPGDVNVTLATLAHLAATFKVGLIVKFVPYSEMLRWENSYSPDTFIVTKIDEDEEFLHPENS